MSETARMMLVHAKAAAKDGDHGTARRYLERVLYNDATHDQKQQAHLWLSRVASDPAEQRDHLEEVLALNPTHGEARRELALLDGRLHPDEVVNPDDLPQTTSEDEERGPRPVTAQRFICPQCAGRMRFEPDHSAVVCLYCGHTSSLLAAMQGGVELEESDFIVALATVKGHALPAGTCAFRCQGCQATLLTAADISTHCPYCGSSHVIEVTSDAVVAPEGVIPFGIDAAAAQASFRAWLETKVQGRPTRTTRVRGVYLPVWTFDLMGEIAWRGIESDRSTGLGGLAIGNSGMHVRGGSSGLTSLGLTGSARNRGRPSQSRVREGSHYVMVNDEIVPATHKVPYVLHEVFYGYNWAQAVPYDARYLNDWPAELYEVAVSHASLVARRRVLDRARSKVTIQAEAQVGDLDGLKIFPRTLMVDTYKLVLVPVWIANYRCEDTIYTVVVNGQTGAVVGQTPPGAVRRFFNSLLGGTQ